MSGLLGHPARLTLRQARNHIPSHVSPDLISAAPVFGLAPKEGIRAGFVSDLPRFRSVSLQQAHLSQDSKPLRNKTKTEARTHVFDRLQQVNPHRSLSADCRTPKQGTPHLDWGQLPTKNIVNATQSAASPITQQRTAADQYATSASPSWSAATHSQRPISRADTPPRMNGATSQSSEARQDLIGQCQSERSRGDARPAKPNPGAQA